LYASINCSSVGPNHITPSFLAASGLYLACLVFHLFFGADVDHGRAGFLGQIGKGVRGYGLRGRLLGSGRTGGQPQGNQEQQSWDKHQQTKG
ncbi:MAG: hypothetical protein ACLPQL_07810, partial [Desulfobaccales bacterium]